MTIYMLETHTHKCKSQSSNSDYVACRPCNFELRCLGFYSYVFIHFISLSL